MLNRILGHVETIRDGISTSVVRNQVISQNIANAETAGYIAKEVNTKPFMQYLNETEKAEIPLAERYEIVNQNEPIKANGNNVNLEKEMNELAKNNIAYQGMIHKISMQFNMIEHVVSDGTK